MFIDEKAEIRLLAAIVDNQQVVLKITDELFTSDRKSIFIAMQMCYKKYGEISSEGVELILGGDLPASVESARGSGNSEALIDYLKILATKRQLVTISNNINNLLNNPKLDIDTVQQYLATKPLACSDDSSLLPGINAFVSELRQKQSGKYRFIDTGLGFLNYMLGKEWPRGAMTVIMAQSGAGKTSLVCSSLLNMARKGIPVSFYSLEMPKKRIVPRLIANMTSIDSMKIRVGNVTPEEEKAIDLALEELQELPIYLNDTSGKEIGLNDILYFVQQHRHEHGIEAFFVDYLQIIANDSGDDEYHSLGRFTQQLRNIAVKEDIASIILSQQNRSWQGLGSLLGSGRIGNIADTVIELKLADQIGGGDARLAEIIFEKNRDGPTGSSCAVYNGKYLRFVDQ